MDSFNFGAVLQKPDPRDYDLSKVASATPTPEVFRPDYSKVAIRHQHKQPACGAHAGSTIDGILALKEGKDGINNSPRFLWSNIKDNDGWPIEVGTDLYSILRNLKNGGVCDIKDMENDEAADSLSLTQYRSPTMTDVLRKAALDRRIEAYAVTYSPTFQQVKDAIFKFGAVIIQYRCGKNMYTDKKGNTSWKAKDILPLSPDRYPMDSGHFVVGTGFDKQFIYWPNSWGEDWGDEGTGWFAEDYVPHIYAIGTAIFKSQVTPEVLPKYYFTKDLTIGSRGPDVVALQKYLEASGYMVMPKGVAYGYFGDITRAGVSKYQIAHGIKPTAGYFGPITRASMNAL